jgi:hypothetical protein
MTGKSSPQTIKIKAISRIITGYQPHQFSFLAISQINFVTFTSLPLARELFSLKFSSSSYHISFFILQNMRSYINYKPPLIVKQGWIFWSTPNFKTISPNSEQIGTLLFINKNKEIRIIYRPTPIVSTDGKLLGIIGNMLEEGSTAAITKIDGKEVGLCFTIQNYKEIPKVFCPEIPLQAKMVKDTKWEAVTEDIALVILPTLAPLPFGRDIESTMLDDDFVEGMAKITVEHGFWAKMMVDTFEQEDTTFDTLPIVNNLNVSKAASKGHDSCRAATIGFQDAWPSNSSPSINTSCIGKKMKLSRQK